jgi:protein disulfide-isomerase
MLRFARVAAFSFLTVGVVGLGHIALVSPAAGGTKVEGAGATWTESFDDAKASAQADQKLILADFTGSDWCHYCVQLKREVLDTADFKAWAAEHVVLLEVDYPRRRKQSPEVAKQNADLKAEFKIDGYPTVVIMNSKGKEVDRIVGYSGAKEWNADLKKIIGNAK